MQHKLLTPIEDGYNVVKQVLVVRKDLNMRKGKIAAQCAHASLGSVMRHAVESNKHVSVIYMYPEMREWLYEGPFTKIVVGCNSEEELLNLEQDCLDAKVHHCLIQDAGKTEFHGEPTYTVLAVGPGKEEVIDAITGHLKLI